MRRANSGARITGVTRIFSIRLCLKPIQQARRQQALSLVALSLLLANLRSLFYPIASNLLTDHGSTLCNEYPSQRGASCCAPTFCASP